MKVITNYNSGGETIVEEIGCGFCWDKKHKKNKELFFLDAANNMRVCIYCPSCGRVMEDDYE